MEARGNDPRRQRLQGVTGTMPVTPTGPGAGQDLSWCSPGLAPAVAVTSYACSCSTQFPDGNV